MQSFLKIVGNGRKTARNFTAEEAEEAFEMVMNGQASLVQVAVMMSALRIKEESIDELTVFTRILRRYCEQLPTQRPHLVDICMPYDGRSKIPLLLPAAALIAAAAGAKVGFHGRLGGVLPPKFGIGVGDVLNELGIAVNVSLQDAASMLDEIGVAFVASEQFAPALTRFDQIRQDFGMRSFFNTIEKLINPFNAPNAIVGVFHRLVMPRVAEAAQAQGYAHGLIVQGPEGSVEILTSRRNPIVEFHGMDALVEWNVDPAALGWWSRNEDTQSYGTAANAELTISLLNPTNESIYRNSTLLSAALILYTSGISPSFESGLENAQKSLASGAPLERLKLWRETSQKWRGSP